MTVEGAIVLSALVVVLGICLAGVLCVVAQLRCTDAAREGARLAARGDQAAARAAVDRLAPGGADVVFGSDGDDVEVIVRAGVAVLPIRVAATARAVAEASP